MSEDRRFAIFILSHGRAANMLTVNTLERYHYTGSWYIIIDDLDKDGDDYRSLFGSDHVIMFDKREAAMGCDTMDNKSELNVVLFARNECHRIASELNLTHFLVLDDDYNTFHFRYIREDHKLRSVGCDLDALIPAVLDTLDVTGAHTIALAQGGDMIGGVGNSLIYKRVLRKAMNSFFCRTDRPFKFMGRINEDVNAYTYLGSRGMLFFTTMEASLVQKETQQNSGGLTDAYLDLGTYVKSFYSVMIMPSAVKVSVMGDTSFRLHHQIDWNACVPKIISSRYRSA